MVELPPPDELYRALVARDAAYEGVFIVAVKTTGIFCRPTCNARKPRFENVEFFADAAAAEAAGYRACLRCKPLARLDGHPAWVERLIAALERDPAQRIRDEDLRALAIEPAQARRYFRARFGMTFQAYQRARRVGFAHQALHAGGDVTRTALDAGFESESGFREAVRRVFGDPPSKARAKDCIAVSRVSSPIGLLITAATPRSVCMLEFADRPALMSQAATLRRAFEEPIVPGTNERLEELHAELAEYFEGTRTRFTVPLAIEGTPFQRQVWERLLAIPFGETRSYGDIAQELDRAGAPRAVGRANGLNRIAIVIPCHRVVHADGTLCGYGGGLWRKSWLLEHEHEVLARSGKVAKGTAQASLAFEPRRAAAR
jgi:AraC family transcriptional regulator of adaptative response/methylated-DNA-[protein]-cysteine methyltransferase